MDIARGKEVVPIAVDVPVEGVCPMAPFVYVENSVISEKVVCDNKRESSCKCYGQDCGLDPVHCECIQKGGLDCAYDEAGHLQELVDGDLNQVLILCSV